MNVLVDVRHGADAIDVERARATALFALARIGAPDDAEVSLSFVDDAEMASLNEGWRGKAGPTDVLSFECDGLDDAFPAPSGAGPYELGDIVIAPDVARRQAAELGTSLPDEIDLLIVHGVLHLRGYDHVRDEDAAVMEPLQREIVDALAKGRA